MVARPTVCVPYFGDMLDVYVPRPGSDLEEAVWAGSGIVGSPEGSTDRLRVDFEGDQDLYPCFADRVRRAAERHQWSRRHREGYPTRACAHVGPTEVIRVGRYDSEEGRVVVVDEAALERWLGVDELPDRELQVHAS